MVMWDVTVFYARGLAGRERQLNEFLANIADSDEIKHRTTCLLFETAATSGELAVSVRLATAGVMFPTFVSSVISLPEYNIFHVNASIQTTFIICIVLLPRQRRPRYDTFRRINSVNSDAGRGIQPESPTAFSYVTTCRKSERHSH